MKEVDQDGSGEHFAFKMMDYSLQKMNFALKMMNVVFKMMNFVVFRRAGLWRVSSLVGCF